MPPQIATNKPGQVRPISIYKPAREGLSRWVIEWAAHFEGRLPAWGAVGGGGERGACEGRAGEDGDTVSISDPFTPDGSCRMSKRVGCIPSP